MRISVTVVNWRHVFLAEIVPNNTSSTVNDELFLENLERMERIKHCLFKLFTELFI